MVLDNEIEGMSNPSFTDWIDQIADRFDSARRQGLTPRIADFIKEAPAERRTLLLCELIKIDLEYRWRSGEKTQVDDYLHEFKQYLDADSSIAPDLREYARDRYSFIRDEFDPAATQAGPDSNRVGELAHCHCPHCGAMISSADSQEKLTCSNCGNSFRADMRQSSTFRVGDLPRPLGKFQLLELLGQGSFGTVFKARDTELDRLVAIKVPRAGSFATADDEERFLREARSAAQLAHPNIVKIHEIAHEGRMPFIVSDFVEGPTLAQVLAERRLGFRESAELAAQIAAAMEYAHGRGIVHRDINPRNIMLEKNGVVDSKTAATALDDSPRLMDFGLARRDDGDVVVTLDGQILGTPAYMAPEQAAGDWSKVDGRSDVYSLGVIMYEMLAGERPFRGTTRMLLHQVLHDEPRSLRRLNDRIPRDLEIICLKAMAKAPARRYSSAGELAADLGRYLKGQPIHARPVGPGERLLRWVKRNPLVAGLTGSAALLLIGITISAVRTAYFRGRVAEQAIREADLIREGQRRLSRRLYISDLRLAPVHWEAGKIDWLLELLDKQRPEHTDGIDLRGIEWYYWQNRCHSELKTFFSHTTEITSVVYSPDGKRLAAVSPDQTLRVWDVESGKNVITLGCDQGSFCCVAFSPDGSRLAAGSTNKTIRIWETATWQLIRNIKAHSDYVTSLAFRPDGRQLVSVGKEQTLRIWDVGDGRQLLVMSANDDNKFGNVAFSPNGNLLASSAEDGKVRIWDTLSWKMKLVLDGHRGASSSLMFSPDGRRLVSAGWDKTIRIWDLMTGNEALLLHGHRDRVISVAYSPDGKRIASGSKDQMAKVWNSATGKELLTLRGHKGQVHSVTFSPDGKRLTTSSADWTIRIWDAIRGQATPLLEGHKKEVYGIAFSWDGRLATASEDGTVDVWDCGNHRLLHTLEGHTKCVNGVTFSPDGNWLASASDDHAVRIWNAASGKELLAFKGHTAQVWCAAFSPDGNRVASVGEDGIVRIWDRTTGKESSCWSGLNFRLLSVAFSPDGKRLVTSSWDSIIRIWEADTGRETMSLEGHETSVWRVSFNRSGTRLASCSNDGTVKLWDLESGKELHSFRGHTAQISTVVFTPDERRLVSASWDGTIKVWDVDSGEEVLSLKGRGERVFAVAISSDGHWLASSNVDGTVQIWDATPTSQ
jgi:WD40 repeat protein/tRNA A-37 threonylcarbamoyl transferase component Bud32